MQTLSLEQDMANYARLTVDVDALANRARRKATTYATMECLINTQPYSSQRSGYQTCLECCDKIKRVEFRRSEDIVIVSEIEEYNDVTDFFATYTRTVEKKTRIWHEPHCTMLVGRYCKKRYCTVCNNIRSMQAYIKYGPVLNLWEQPYFVTLTVRNAPQNSLISLMDEMQKTWERCKNIFAQEAKRKGLPIPSGLRKLECTYNPTRNDYHPHYHIIADSQESAERIVSAWLNQWPADLCSPKAQNLKPADRNSIFELFKYFAKSIDRKEGDNSIYPVALNCQFEAMSGRRVIQDFNMGQYKTTFGQDVKPEKPEGHEFGRSYWYDATVGDWRQEDDRNDRIIGVDRGPEMLVIRGMELQTTEQKPKSRNELYREIFKHQNTW